MTVPSSENKRSYTGNGLTKVFSFPYLFYASDDLRVYLDGVRQTSGYTVLGEGTNLGTVTFLTAPAVDVVVYIDRYVSFTQDTDFENFDGNPSDVTEKQFDLLVMQTQQLNEADSRTLIVPVGDSATNLQLPSVTNRASKFLAFDSAGNPIAAAAATSEGTAFGATGLLLAAASTPADAIATLALFTSAQSVTSTWNFNGTLNVNAKLVTPDKSELTISSGAVQPNGVFHTLDTQGDAATDDWDTILSPTNGQWNIFRTANSARAVVVKHGTGNISIANNLDINLTSTNRAILTVYDLELNKNLVIADGTTKEYVDAAATNSRIISGTPQNSTSGTAIPFGSLPEGIKRLTVNFVGVSTNGTRNILIQLNNETTGYLGATGIHASSFVQPVNYTNGINIPTAAASINHGTFIFDLVDAATFTWACTFQISTSDAGRMYYGAYTKSLSEVLTQLRITTANGTDAFDAGKININYQF